MDDFISSVFCEMGIQYKNTFQLKLEVGIAEAASAKDWEHSSKAMLDESISKPVSHTIVYLLCAHKLHVLAVPKHDHVERKNLRSGYNANTIYVFDIHRAAHCNMFL